MNGLLRQIENLQDFLYIVEDFVENCKDNELIEFLSENWKECLFGSIGAYLAFSYSSTYIMQMENQKKIDAKRSKLEDKKRELLNELKNNALQEVMTLERETILGLHITELLDQLKSGELDPLAVLQAYQARALESTEQTNCVVDFILEAHQHALELRKVPEEYRGPLYGLPISVKECFFVKGYDATAGLARYIDSPAEEDGGMVKRMRDLGAIPFCLTNVPQTMNTYACSNPVFGLTTHPLDNTRTPGGSSGGEACLISMGGSIFGLGSDVGGSLRIPAHFCGISSLKPTSGRIFERGRRKGVLGSLIGVQSNAGFMSQKVEGVIVGMKSLLEKDVQEMSDIDYKVHPIPWNENLFQPQKKRLKIGYYTEDGYFPLTPACKRAVEVAIEAVSGAGCEIVYFRPPNLEVISHYFFDHMLADAGANSLPMWKNEILDQAIEVNNLVYKIPLWIRRNIIGPLLRLLSPIMSDVSSRGLTHSKDLSISLRKLDEIIHEILTTWQNQNIDVVIAPGFAFPAPPVKHPARLVPAVAYTAAYNVVNFPAGTVPVTRVTSEDEIAMKDYPRGKDLLFQLVYEGAKKNTVGLPLGVQIIGRPYQEELVLHVMQLLENHVKFE